MEQDEQWLEEKEEEEAALRGRRHRNRNNSNTIATAAASGTTSNDSLSLNPTDETRPHNKEEEEAAAAATEEEEEEAAAAAAAEEEEDEKLDDAAGNEEGRFENIIYLGKDNDTDTEEEEEAAAAVAEKEEAAAAAAEEEEDEKLDDAAGKEEGRFENIIYLGKDNDTDTAFVAEEIEEGRLEKSVSLDKDKDTESTNGFSGMRYSSAQCSVFEPNPEDQKLDVTEKHFEIQESLSTVIKHQYEEKLNDESLSGFSLLPSERSCEDQNTSYKILDTGSIKKADAILIKESYQEVTELDVERVLENQESHDLYCPNCNSCITRRVILRKRKRKIGNIQHKAERDKFKTKVDSELEADPVYSANGKARDTVDVCLDGGPTPAVGDYNQDREPDIFRCLACFRFFIPTGDGFKLFRIFGDREENEDMQNPRQISATNTNWLFSIFASDKGKMAIEQGGEAQDVSEVDIVKQSSTPLAGGTLVNTGEPMKDAILKPQEGGLKFPVPSTAGSLMLEESQRDQKYNMAIRNETLPYQSEHATTEPKEDGKDIVVSSKEGPMFSENVTTVLEEQSVDAVENNNTGIDKSLRSSMTGMNPETLKNGKGSAAQERLLEHILPDHPVTQVAGKTLVNTKEPAEDSTLKPQLGALKILSTTAVSSMLEKSKIDLSQSSDVQHGNETLPDQNESGYPVMQFSGRTLVNTKEPAEDYILKPQLDALKSAPTTAVSLMLEKSEIDLTQKSDMGLRNETLPDQKGYASSIQGASLPDQSFFSGGLVNKVTIQSLEARKDIVVPSTQGSIRLEKLMTDVTEKSDDAVVKNRTGVDVILTVESGAVQAASSQRVQSITVSGETEILTRTQINEGHQNSAEASEVQGWDILKSIVYGGLIESITSLGVLSSAAGADAATLNVLALGLANLFGGLFIIGHNLRDLKNDNSGGTSNQMNEQVDRYQELLGQRRNFILHAIVAVSSFLIFGLLPPVIYGFSFRKSDNRDLKLAAVMAASLLCIILLAIGKCYVQRPPKSYIKTVLHYVIIGFMASGASYIIGSLIKKLLDELGWFKSSSAVAMPFLKTGTAKPAWASY